MEHGNGKTWRLSISLTEEMEDAIVKLRQNERYTRMSFGEIIRLLISAGLEQIDQEKSA